MSQNDSRLRVDDDAFLVDSIIERCPKDMMLRELVMNAIEAARSTEGKSGKVQIGTTELFGAKKLTIRNSGPGMDAAGLRRMTDIAASLGKVKGLSGNFGMGGKVASLPSNHLGVRYRSCTGGRIFEVVIGRFGGVYSRRVNPSSDGRSMEVVDVTREYNRAALQEDWTEVVLFGQSPGQDTLVDPYAGDPVAPAFWIPEALYYRFFRIPAGVEIVLEEGAHWGKGAQRFLTIADRRARGAFAQTETVVTPDGLSIHYIYDPAHEERPWENASSDGALQSTSSIAAVVFRNELYDVRSGSPWISEAPQFGISFAARHVSVLVELPDNYEVLPEMYRSFLYYEGGDQEQVAFDQFAADVRNHRPQWLRDIFDSYASEASPSEDVVSDLKDFQAELGVLLYDHVDPPNGEDPEARAKWRAPELSVVQLFDEVDINDRWLNGRAACYYEETKELFINARYESIALLSKYLATEILSSTSGGYSREDVEYQAGVVAREAVVRRLGRSLLYGLSKRSDPERWQKGHIEKAVSPETFTVVADEWRDLAPAALDSLRRMLRSN